MGTERWLVAGALLAVGVALLSAREARGAIVGGRWAGRNGKVNPRESDEDSSSEDSARGPPEDGLAAWKASLDAQVKRREQDEKEERERLARLASTARTPTGLSALPPSAAPPSTGLPSTVPPTAAYATSQVVRLTDPDSQVQDFIRNNSSANFTPPEVTSNKKQNEIFEDQKQGCDEEMEDAAGYVRLPGTSSRYKFFATPASWEAARARCARDGAHLAVANDHVEALALVYLMRATLFPANPSHMHVGASDNQQEGVWRTEDGSEFNDTYFRWARNQPEINNRKQNCMQLYDDLTNVDFNCGGKAPFPCEKSICTNIQG